MKLTVRLLLLIVVFVFLIASKISDFQTSDSRNIFKNGTHAGYLDRALFGALLKVVKNSETTTSTTTTTVTKTFEYVTKSKLNNNNDVPAKDIEPNVDKVPPPKLQQFLPSVWIYTAHREVLFCLNRN